MLHSCGPELRSRAFTLKVDLIRRRSEPMQNHLGQRKTDFALSRHDPLCTGVLERREISEVRRTGKDVDVRVEILRMSNRLATLGHPRRRKNKVVRVSGACLREGISVRGVSVDGAHPAFT